MAWLIRRQNSSGSSAASGCSATIRSTMPSAQQVGRADPLPGPSRPRASVSRCRIAEAPSGGSGESQRAARRSPGRRASARGRRRRCPGRAARTASGASSVTRSARQRAISPASPPSSASFDSAAPGGVDHASPGAGRSSAASRIPRRATRSAPGPSGASSVWPRRSWPRTTHGRAAEPRQRQEQPRVVLALARCRAAGARPWRRACSSAPDAGPVVAPGADDRLPRAARRRSSLGGQLGHVGQVLARAHEHVQRAVGVSASASAGRIASMRPCSKRFSAVCTPSGNGSP